ncbi:MAG TPA: phosphatase PAP2 family protein [Thermoanaerobaculia bacterium]|nr:phosphatase PAP2 family protein [Thermoanaerobaculia bacterium]
MSTGDDLRKSRLAAAGFIALLALSVFWPSPVVSSNRLWINWPLDVDELSFLGREAPSWDVVYWCLAGIFTLIVLQTGHPFRLEPLRRFRAMRPALPRRFGVAAGGAVVIIAVVWLVADAPLIAAAETIRYDATESIIRIVNRFGGGMNPAMIVLFFLIAGIVYRREAWVSYAVMMAVAGLGAGLIAHVIKLTAGRTRPELWLGPFHLAHGSANSFPSGHTVGAFALAGVLLFASRSVPLRVVAMLLACAVGLSRIVAFRHWPSDVVASAAIGLLVAYASTSAKFTETSREQPASSIVTP